MAEEEKRHGPPPPKVVDRPAGRTYNSDVYTKRYLDSMVIEMRIVGSQLASTEAEFFGKKINTPIMLGPMGEFRNPDYYTYEAEAARDLGAVMWISGFTRDEYVRKCVDIGANVVSIVKPHHDNAIFLDCIKKAEQNGVMAIGTDIDHGFTKDGELDSPDGLFTLGPKSIEDLHKAVESVSVPYIAKGVLSVHDALACKEAGAAAIVLSHHHSIMDCAVPPLMILPAVREAVGPDFPVFVDCSIDTGADAFKALALGADLVSSSRAILARVPKGKDAIQDYVKKMTGELKHFLDRTSSPDIKHIDPSVIHFMPYV